MYTTAEEFYKKKNETKMQTHNKNKWNKMSK